MERKLPSGPTSKANRSEVIARIRSLTEPKTVKTPPERTAAAVMRTTGATMASMALMAMGFMRRPYDPPADVLGRSCLC